MGGWGARGGRGRGPTCKTTGIRPAEQLEKKNILNGNGKEAKKWSSPPSLGE
jgi:hypothetical protein